MIPPIGPGGKPLGIGGISSRTVSLTLSPEFQETQFATAALTRRGNNYSVGNFFLDTSGLRQSFEGLGNTE
jgi:hypothetical protein